MAGTDGEQQRQFPLRCGPPNLNNLDKFSAKRMKFPPTDLPRRGAAALLILMCSFPTTGTRAPRTCGNGLAYSLCHQPHNGSLTRSLKLAH